MPVNLLLLYSFQLRSVLTGKMKLHDKFHKNALKGAVSSGYYNYMYYYYYFYSKIKHLSSVTLNYVLWPFH